MADRMGSVRIGIDIGALSIKLAVDSGDGEVRSIYRLHQGEVPSHLEELLQGIDGEIAEISFTGSGGRQFAERFGAFYCDSSVAAIANLDPSMNVRHIADIGGASLAVVDIDEEGRFAGYRTNSLCAAGTGSFLDEQAIRMGIGACDRSLVYTYDDPPRIAARCAVFAKSDLIHRQQEGYSIDEMWSGLCRGMATTALSTLFKGRTPAGPVLLVGGVALNLEVVRWLKSGIGAELICAPDPQCFVARGALALARKPRMAIARNLVAQGAHKSAIPMRPKLQLLRSKYPSFECDRVIKDQASELRIHKKLSGDCAIGIDIGSTSTKAAVIALDGSVIADCYLRTSGDPIGAVWRLLTIIREAADGELNIIAAGTTGSGRKMIGSIIGADSVVNEITAHVRGALATDPDVETIFEIGGQDSKFIALKDGAPVDSNMNYICAAGTGSFVEEQAGKLGIPLEEIGDLVMGVSPPQSSDRCTVFMEQDVHALLRQGFDKREALGSVLISVVQNYLGRVVGRRSYSKEKICFMGATARNRGLVAAFEQQTGAEIVVSPYCHVMGALGVAQIALAGVIDSKIATSFRGFAVAEEEVVLSRTVCNVCANNCEITHAVAEGANGKREIPSWGYMCGRDPTDEGMKLNSGYDAFRKRDRLWIMAGGRKEFADDAINVGIPRSLLTYSYLPLWRKFFSELGVRVILSKATHDGTLESASDRIAGEYCYPVKLAHGHVRELSNDPKVDFIFLPFMVQGEEHDDGFKRSVFCPYNIAFPSIAKAAGLNEPCGKEISTAVINMQLSIDIIVDEIASGIGSVIKKTRTDIEAAWIKARAEQESFSNKIVALGRESIVKLELAKERGIVVIGRPYNVYDTGANLGLPSKIADLGFTVLSVDMLPIEDVQVDPIFQNMYWLYGRKILQAAKYVKEHPHLHAVYLTNFGCGPDSFLQSYVEKIMAGKPMLLLEFDEHSADAGYMTRLEAFRDVISGKGVAPKELSPAIDHATRFPKDKEIRTLWIPPMHPIGSRLLAAALRYEGTPARALPTETHENFSLAKRYCRGTECVPLPATTGAFLAILKKSDDPGKEALFMPSAKGPCRFGQYHTLQRMILDAAGYRDSKIESWSDETGSYGLSPLAMGRIYGATMCADLLYKMRCRLRPYAIDRNRFDADMEQAIQKVEVAIENCSGLKKTLRQIADSMSKVPLRKESRPLIGIVGEIYVRLNTFTNGNLVEVIEDAGGEAWVAPVTEWFQYLSYLDIMIARDRKYSMMKKLKVRLKRAYMTSTGNALERCLAPVIADRAEPPIASTLKAGEIYFPRQFDGESIMTIGRGIEFVHQGADLIINCAPFGCMPGTLTSGIFEKVEKEMGVPFVSLFFDGERDLSHVVTTYIENVKRRGKKSSHLDISHLTGGIDSDGLRDTEAI